MSMSLFDLATPDPDFPGFTVRPEDQLPGRPVEGRIEIARFFEQLQLFVTEGQRETSEEAGGTNGSTIYNDLKANDLPVLGPNVGQFLFEHQSLIPAELRGNTALVFWGKVYRDSGGGSCVQCLRWHVAEWIWDYDWVDSDHWYAFGQAVVLAR